MDGARSEATAVRVRVVVIGAFAVSLLVRIVVLRDLLARDPLLRAPYLDDRAYLDMARSMADGHAGAWFMAPLYPWLLAVAARFLPLGMPVACGLNAVLGAAATGTAAAAGCALHSRAAGIGAAVLHGLLGVFVFQDVTPGQETVLTLLHLAALLLAVHLARDGRLWIAAAVGFCAGVAVLGRGTSAALLLVAIPALVRAGGRRRLLVGAACAAGFLVVLLPAALRNAAVAGDPSPLPWARGPNLYAANCADARATVSFQSVELSAQPSEMERRAPALARAATGRDLTPGEVSDWWTRRAWAERGPAGEFVAHTLRKAALFWAADERGSNHSALAEGEFSPWLAFSPVHAWWLLAAGAASWWLLRPRHPAADGVALAVAGTWILLTVVFPVARFRLPVAAMSGVLVASAAVEAVRGAAPARRLAGSAGILVLASIAAFLPIREPAEGMAHVNLAAAHLAAGDGRPVVLERLRRALVVEPGCGPAHEMLGRMLLEDGDAASAYAHFVDAAQDRRSRWSAQVAALPALVAMGRLDEAARTAHGLLGERRDDPELLANAALVAAARGDRAEAAVLLAAARRLAPNHPAVLRAAAQTGL